MFSDAAASSLVCAFFSLCPTIVTSIPLDLVLETHSNEMTQGAEITFRI